MTKRNPGPRAAAGNSNDPARTTPKQVPKKSARTSAKPAVKSSSRPTAASGSASDHREARIVAVANQKGGVGKSTTAVNLGAALTELGLRVLVADLDPQGNASTGMGIKHESREVTVYDVLASEAPVDQAIVPSSVEGLYAIPSTIDLAGAEIELVSQFSRELRLRRAIEPLKTGEDGYDFIFLDCPPSLGLLTINALAAAEELIVPIQCEYYALEGLGQLLHNVRLVQQNINPTLRLTGIIMTMFDSRTKLSEQVVDEVRRYFGDRVYDAIIPRTVRLSEAPGFGQPITVYDPKSRGAESYRALAREVVARPRPEVEPMPVYEDMPRVILSAAAEGSAVESDITAGTHPPAPEGEPRPAAAKSAASAEPAPAAEGPAGPAAVEAAPATRAVEPTSEQEPAPEQLEPSENRSPGKGPIRSGSASTAKRAPARAKRPKQAPAAAKEEAGAAPVAPAPPGDPSKSTTPASSSRTIPQPQPEPQPLQQRPRVPGPQPTAAPTAPTAPIAPEDPSGRRVVVIDQRAHERAVMSGQESAGRRSQPPVPGGQTEGGVSEIGETLPQEPKKKKWWRFGKGGEG